MSEPIQASFVATVSRIASDANGGFKLTVQFSDVTSFQALGLMLNQNAEVAVVLLPRE